MSKSIVDWQPIETAPKTQVLLLTDGGQLWVGFWQDGYGWLTGFTTGPLLVRLGLEPTHWAELPDGPGKAHTEANP